MLVMESTATTAKYFMVNRIKNVYVTLVHD